MTKRLLSNAILAICGFAAASNALALGFGRIPESIAFGQVMDISVPVRLDPGESIAPGCLRAEVSIGERRLPAEAVRLDLERGADGREGPRVRLRSNAVVQEPLVTVGLSLGCNGPVSRQFVLFADPPRTGAPLAVEPPAAVPALAAANGAPARADAAQGAAAAAPVAAPPSLTTRTQKVRTAAPAARAEGPRGGVQARAAAATPPKAGTAERAVPRLKLEEADDRLQAAMLAVAAQDAAAASAARAAGAAQAAASAAGQRMAMLEKNLQDLRAQAASHRVAVEHMRQRVGQAENQVHWMWALALVVLMLAACALWLGLRVRALQRERQAGSWLVAQAPVATAGADAAAGGELQTPDGDAPSVPSPAPTSTSQSLPAQASPTAPSTTARLTGATAVATAAEAEAPRSAGAGLPDSTSPPHRGSALVGAVTAQEALTRAVTVDELIDLEQQAEFFIVLGEEDAATDLLMSHLRSTGGISPLPYLRLLEIYRRRQDPEAYERMRKRFNHRFNAVAPDWQTDPDAGRDLQDYPCVLATLQAAWQAPRDAMAELENLLFRKRSNELFELPAYGDVLTLFAVARDLHRSGELAGDDVDVLLPLLTPHELSATLSNSIFDRLDRSGDGRGAVLDDRPTAPIDLDLSEASAGSAALQRSH